MFKSMTSPFLDTARWLVESVWILLGLMVVVLLWVGIALQYAPILVVWKILDRWSDATPLDEGIEPELDAAGSGTGRLLYRR